MFLRFGMIHTKRKKKKKKKKKLMQLKIKSLFLLNEQPVKKTFTRKGPDFWSEIQSHLQKFFFSFLFSFLFFSFFFSSLFDFLFFSFFPRINPDKKAKLSCWNFVDHLNPTLTEGLSKDILRSKASSPNIFENFTIKYTPDQSTVGNITR